MTRRIVLLLTALYWLALFVVTHVPANTLHGPGGDKLHHFLAYLVLSFMLGATFWQVFPKRRRLVPILVVLVGAGYGVFDELTQIPVGRAAEVGDWVADVSGAVAAAVALFLLERRATARGATPAAPDSALAIEPR